MFSLFFFLFLLSESLYKLFNYVLFALRPYASQESSYNSVPKKILQNEGAEISGGWGGLIYKTDGDAPRLA